MAYKRYGRKRYRKRYRQRRGGNSMWNIAKKAANGIVKYYLNPEYKFLDNSGQVNPSSTGQVISGNGLIAQGDTDITRDGNSIKVTSWLHRITLEKNASATSTRFRIILFSDVSSAGAVPAVTDLLQTASVISPLNRVNGSRFHVLQDKTCVLDTDTPQKVFEFYKKMQHHIKYLDGTANTTSLGQGSLYVLILSNEATNTPTMNYYSRMRFLDN